MIQYKEFEETVQKNSSTFEAWKHLLPAVPLAHRSRFITALKTGADIPTAFDYIMTSLTLREDKFLNFLEEATQKRISMYA
ncbi:MAG: hypothetical protein EOP56_14660 [Sphingobacteriales bacterium]|nr:MAG: hypothetical protein EOP56_14660 [Sphingobacteriales bacterium]